MHYNGADSTNETFKELEETLVNKGVLHSGDVFIKTASMPFHGQGRTNMLKITEVA